MTALKPEAQEQSDCPLERFHVLSGMTCGCPMHFALEDEAHMSVSDMDPCSSWLASQHSLSNDAPPARPVGKGAAMVHGM